MTLVTNVTIELGMGMISLKMHICGNGMSMWNLENLTWLAIEKFYRFENLVFD